MRRMSVSLVRSLRPNTPMQRLSYGRAYYGCDWLDLMLFFGCTILTIFDRRISCLNYFDRLTLNWLLSIIELKSLHCIDSFYWNWWARLTISNWMLTISLRFFDFNCFFCGNKMEFWLIAYTWIHWVPVMVIHWVGVSIAWTMICFKMHCRRTMSSTGWSFEKQTKHTIQQEEKHQATEKNTKQQEKNVLKNDQHFFDSL